MINSPSCPNFAPSKKQEPKIKYDSHSSFCDKENWPFALGAITAVLLGFTFACHAISYEITGHGNCYHIRHRGRIWREPITRESSPRQFREITNNRWAASGCCFIIAGLGIYAFYEFEKRDYEMF